MPKTKTNSGAKKRFKMTGKNKLMCKHVGMRHNLGKKTVKQKRKLGNFMEVSKADKPRMLQLLS